MPLVFVRIRIDRLALVASCERSDSNAGVLGCDGAVHI
jgi:hypothetical protein